MSIETKIVEALAARYGLTPDQLAEKLGVELQEAAASPQVEKGMGTPKPEPSPQKVVGGAGPRAKPMLDATDEAKNPEPRDLTDPALEETPETMASAQLAREERMKLLPEYLKFYFLEDLPPIDPEDPWNQGIYMRFRLNQMRYARGEDPVGFEEAAAPAAPEATEAPPVSPEAPAPAPTPEAPPVTPEAPPEVPAEAPVPA